MITSDTTFSDFLHRLQTLHNQPEEARLYADTYLTIYARTFPIIEGNTAHFVYKAAPDKTVGIHAEWNGGNALRSIMTPIGAGLVHYQQEFESDARLDYELAEMPTDRFPAMLADPLTHYNSGWHLHLDPLNAHQGISGFGPRSELAMPAYQRPEITRSQPDVKRGRLHKGSLWSDVLQQERSYTVYLPPGFDEHATPCASAYFHDGNDYLSMGFAPIILDNLLHDGTIPPTVAVFVPPVAREYEYNCNDQFVQFFCDELVPELQRLYHLDSQPARRAIIGPSMGGIASLYIASKRPDVFGLVGAQSTVTKSVNESSDYDAHVTYAVEPPLPLRVHLVMGSYETCFDTKFAVKEKQGCRDLLTPVQEFHTLLERYGYQSRYVEEHQGHSWGLWRDTLGDALTYLFASA